MEWVLLVINEVFSLHDTHTKKIKYISLARLRTHKKSLRSTMTQPAPRRPARVDDEARVAGQPGGHGHEPLPALRRPLSDIN